MEKFVRHTGIVCPLDRSNVDTDAIIPKQFLKSIYKTGYGPNLFDGWRYLDKGEPGMDCSKRPLNPDFVLNKPQYRDSTILLARKNFGCGSSREHAPIALLNMGAKAVIADSFARIFFRNAVNLGLVPVICKGISKKVKEGQTLTLDFVKGVVTVQETGESYPCEALGEQAMKILAAGGIKPLMRARFAKEKAEQKAE